MKMKQLLVFLLAVFSVYFTINYYIFVNGLNAFSGYPRISIVYTCFFLFFSISFILGFITERKLYRSPLNLVFSFSGTVWLAAMFYFLIIILVIQLFVFLGGFFFDLSGIDQALRFHVAVAVIYSVFLMVILGHGIAVLTKIKRLDIKIKGKPGGMESLNIVAVSDIHLGTLIGKRKVERLVKKINALNPDLIILAGDILSEGQGQILEFDTGRDLEFLKARFGVYAVPGNHEYIGGIETAIKYLTSKNIRILRDESLVINNSFILAGRDDKDKLRFTGQKRKALSEIIHSERNHLPLILIDHQPIAIDEAVSNGVDLQISGHTHKGQIFPLNFLVKKVFKIGYGYKKIKESHFYVSSGFGTWGPPIRLGTRSEIVNIHIEFENT